MTTKERYKGVLGWFSEHMGLAETELHYRNPYELIVAVILSAQCTDKRVNMTTPAIFERFPEPAAMAAGSVEEIYQLIKSISYPNNKAKHLYEMARKLVSDFQGEVPEDFELLQTLPGVGRKTANVIMADAGAQTDIRTPACHAGGYTCFPGNQPDRFGESYKNTFGN